MDTNNIKKNALFYNIEIPFIKPMHLAKLAKDFRSSKNFPNIKSSFEFPPKSIELVVKLLFDNEYEKLNFFDIARLLKQLEQDILQENIDKKDFTFFLEELFYLKEKYIQNLILNVFSRISIKNNQHSFKLILIANLKSYEFKFIGLCVNKQFDTIQKLLEHKSLKQKLKYYGLSRIFFHLHIEYSQFLMKQLLDIGFIKKNIELYKNNLLDEDDLINMYQEIEELIELIEKDKSNNYLDEILMNILGNIENTKSKWYQLKVPPALQERYKRIKGVFEFQRFVDIVAYLTSHPNLHLSSDEHSSDIKRLRNRSAFWSNYDERFSSVKMWVSEEDYSLMKIDKPVDLNDIKRLKNIKNEVCVLEFKETQLLILEFFRLKDGSKHFNSMIFEGDIIVNVKNLLNKEEFDIYLYIRLNELADFTIRHKFLWQGWVDEFLRNKNIYPNTSILEGNKFTTPMKFTYKKNIGLQNTRNDALKENIKYQDIIRVQPKPPH